jgi:V8-like Glu-specific endopeptidase
VGLENERSSAETLDYWSAERMRSARPIQVSEASIAAAAAAPATREPQTGGPPERTAVPHRVSGTAPAGGEVGPPKAPFGNTLQRRVWYRYMIRHPSRRLYRTNGKLFARGGRNRTWFCSATVVDTPNKSVIFTAAHCLRDVGPRGHWYSDFVFIPAFKNGRRPFGRFAWDNAQVLPGWVQSGPNNFNYDVGALVLRRNKKNQRVARAVGGVGIATSYTRRHYWYVYGYPASYPFSGRNLYTCESPSWGQEWNRMRGPNPTEIACDLTGGSSGGGWIWRAFGGRYLNSVMSHGPDWPSRDSFGTYFGRAVWKLYKTVGRL